MKMNRETYHELLLRFARELNDIGVTTAMLEEIKAQYDRHPNVAGCSAQEHVNRFVYQFGGFEIEAVQTIDLKLRKKKTSL